MYVKITRSGSRQYLQLVEAYRDPVNGKAKQRHLATLGRLDRLSESDLDGLINGLLRVTDRATLDTLSAGIDSASTTFETALQLGDVWVLSQLWQHLKLGQAIKAGIQGRRYRIDMAYLVQLLVMNRLSDPCSKLGVLRWCETVYLPGGRRRPTHQQLLRAMDALMSCKDPLERRLAATLLPQFSDDLEVVFYDITTIRVQGDSERDDDLRQYGYSKEGGTGLQYAVGVVQTAEGVPITHEVFAGNVSEAKTLCGIVERLSQRFALKRLVVIADRGMLSLDNLDTLEALTLPGGQTLEYIVAVPARRCTELTAPLRELHARLVRDSRQTNQECIAEITLEDQRRLVVAHDPQRARQQRRHRSQQLREVFTLAEALEANLNGQDRGQGGRGRKLTDHGAKLQLHQAVVERRLSALIDVDQNAQLFNWGWNQAAFRQAWQRDGKLVLITNVSDYDAAQVVQRYKALADIERGFRVLKSDLDIAPVYHRLPDRIRAHTFVCFLALVLQRVIRHRLYQHRVAGSPHALLEQLKAIQRHEVRLGTGKRLVGVSRITAQQQTLFKAIGIEVPTEQRLVAAM